MKIRILLSILAVLGFTSAGWASPILNTSGDGFEDLSDQSVYGFYQNSGTWLFTESGNNTKDLKLIEQKIETELHLNTDFVLMETSYVKFTPYDNNSGTWETIPPLGQTGMIDFYAVKAGNFYAVYKVDPAAATGSYSTFDIWLTEEKGAGGNSGLEISHFTGYNPTSVPEPGTLLYLGFALGLLGAAGVGRKNNLL